jgi:hypothetical protein
LECYWLLLANAFLGLFGRRMDGFSTYARQGILTAAQELRLAYA